MGFDILICPLINSQLKGDSVDSTYLSYNFSCFSKICVNHPLNSNQCSCEKTPLWYFRNDCHRRCGKDIAVRAQRALDFLITLGISPGTPDLQNSSWGWGVNCNPKETLEVFAYHINRFMQLGNQYPKYFFFGDVEGDDDPILPDDYSSDENDIVQVPNAVTYYRHPFKGTMAIRTFKDAMEIYGLCKALNDPRADGWYNLAFSMADSPLLKTTNT